VIDRPTITPLVTAPPVVLGLTNVRGEVVPVYATAVLVSPGDGEAGAEVDDGVDGQVDHTAGGEGDGRHLVVVEGEVGRAALALWGCPEPATVDDRLDPEESDGAPHADRAGIDASVCAGWVRCGDRRVALLDVDLLLQAAMR